MKNEFQRRNNGRCMDYIFFSNDNFNDNSDIDFFIFSKGMI